MQRRRTLATLARPAHLVHFTTTTTTSLLSYTTTVIRVPDRVWFIWLYGLTRVRLYILDYDYTRVPYTVP